MKANKGFTLLEILVVLAIMGFLMALVAPKMAGITDDATDKVSETNIMRMVSYMRIYLDQTSRFPEHLTNIVVQSGGGYELPTISDLDPKNGAETLAKKLDDRNKLKIHILSVAEATELNKMGVVNILNLNSYDRSPVTDTDRHPSMNRGIINAGVGVAMIGIGNHSTAAPLPGSVHQRKTTGQALNLSAELSSV